MQISLHTFLHSCALIVTSTAPCHINGKKILAGIQGGNTATTEQTQIEALRLQFMNRWGEFGRFASEKEGNWTAERFRMESFEWFYAFAT